MTVIKINFIMRKSKNQLFILGAVLMGTLSSCNRGVGCPSNFSIDMDTIETATTALTSVLSILF